MIRLRRLVALVVWWGACAAGAARAPKIYNALITSDENLSPSQAFPIVEPVLRTTALGVAPYAQPLFQPLLVHHQAPAQQSAPPKDEKQSQPSPLNYNDAYPLYPLAYDPYLQYGYQRDFVYSPPLPFYQQPVYIDYGHGHLGHYQPQEQLRQQQQHEQANTREIEKSPEATQDVARPVIPVLPPQTAQAAPPHVSHVNFKKNPDIPDVIPPLPFTLRKDKKDIKQKRNYK